MVDYRKLLEKGIEKLSLPFSITQKQIDLLLSYHVLLIKWNKAYNLTAIRDAEKMLSRHILDSLTIAPFIKNNNQQQRFIDVGTGAGLPGIILAIIFPEIKFDLLDSNGKKTRFLFQVKTELNLENVGIYHCRVEQYKDHNGYDGVLSRAFATLEDMVVGSEHLLNATGKFFAMKGVYPGSEIKQLSTLEKPYMVSACHPLMVIGDEGERHLVIVSK